MTPLLLINDRFLLKKAACGLAAGPHWITTIQSNLEDVILWYAVDDKIRVNADDLYELLDEQ